MRLTQGTTVRRTGLICAVAGFMAGLVTMNVFSSVRMGDDEGGRRMRVVMQQRRHEHGDADVVGVDNAHNEDGDHAHLHDHRDHGGSQLGAAATSGSRVVDLAALDRQSHQGLNSGGSCSYTWTAVPHRHVLGGQHDPTSTTIDACQGACINRTDCTGVDFNKNRMCFLIVTGSREAEEGHVDQDHEKHEQEEGCVHYDLKRACGSAADDDSVAGDLSRTVRVLCWIMTTPENHMSKAVHVQATWGRRCTKLLFVTEKDDTGALSAVRVDVETGREHLTAKTMTAFQHVYEHHINDAEWFMKADDDTYVIMENLRYFLSSQDPNEPVYFGHHFKVIVTPQGYPSGGAGYVLSKEALTRFGQKHRGLCHEDQGAEDVEIGDCMQRLGVRLGDSRDALGRSRFHCFNPETHIHGGYPDWYYMYDKYGAQKGIESISDYAISFHYISVEQLYNLEFYVYHLRPYGVISGLQNLNRSNRTLTLSFPSTNPAPAALTSSKATNPRLAPFLLTHRPF